MRVLLVALLMNLDMAAFASAGPGESIGSIGKVSDYSRARERAGQILGKRRKSKLNLSRPEADELLPHVLAYNPTGEGGKSKGAKSKGGKSKGAKSDVIADLAYLFGVKISDPSIDQLVFPKLPKMNWLVVTERIQARRRLGHRVVDQFRVFQRAKVTKVKEDQVAAQAALENLQQVPGDFLYQAFATIFVESNPKEPQSYDEPWIFPDPLDGAFQTLLDLLRNGRLALDDAFWESWVNGAEGAKFASALIAMNVVRAEDVTSGGLKLISELAQEHFFDEKKALFYPEVVRAKDRPDSEWIRLYGAVLPQVRDVAAVRAEYSKDQSSDLFPSKVTGTVDWLDREKTEFFLKFDEVRRWGISAATHEKNRAWFAGLIKKRPGLLVDLRTATVGKDRAKPLLRTIFPSGDDSDQKMARLWYYTHALNAPDKVAFNSVVLQDILASLPRPLDCSVDPVVSLMSSDQVVESFRKALLAYREEVRLDDIRDTPLYRLAASVQNTIEMLSRLEHPPKWLPAFIESLKDLLGEEWCEQKLALVNSRAKPEDPAPSSAVPATEPGASAEEAGGGEAGAAVAPGRTSSLYDWAALEET